MDILIVEDDPAIGEPLAEGLRLHGFSPTLVGTGAEGLALASGHDLVLLDLGLPDLDGIEVCRRIRQDSDVPVILLTAREEELDKVMGFEVGADDYVTKPFSIRELVGRMRAVTRRSAAPAVAVPGEPGGSEVTTAGALIVDRRERRVQVAGREVDLSPREFDLLSLLASDVGAVLTRERLMDEVWDVNWFGSTKTLDVHVGQVRKKLGSPDWIETVRGVGFRLVRLDEHDAADDPATDGPATDDPA